MTNIIAFPRQTSTDQFPQLEDGERLFLWGFRTMAQHLRCECQIGVVIHRAYAEFLVEDAVGALEALVQAFASTAHTSIEVHSPDCPCVSEGEISLLNAMAAAQAGELNVARRQFEHWLPELAADWILGPVSGFASIFQAAGLALPRRDVGTTHADGGRRPPGWSAGSDARH